MNEEIYAKISKYIAVDILKQPDRVIGNNEPLISSGLIDSFNRIDLSLFIEDTWGVVIDDKELKAETLDTLEKFVAVIVSRK